MRRIGMPGFRARRLRLVWSTPLELTKVNCPASSLFTERQFILLNINRLKHKHEVNTILGLLCSSSETRELPGEKPDAIQAGLYTAIRLQVGQHNTYAAFCVPHIYSYL